jgi:hypothetical protein
MYGTKVAALVLRAGFGVLSFATGFSAAADTDRGDRGAAGATGATGYGRES